LKTKGFYQLGSSEGAITFAPPAAYYMNDLWRCDYLTSH